MQCTIQSVYKSYTTTLMRACELRSMLMPSNRVAIGWYTCSSALYWCAFKQKTYSNIYDNKSFKCLETEQAFKSAGQYVISNSEPYEKVEMHKKQLIRQIDQAGLDAK